jgi:hypothetical protein
MRTDKVLLTGSGRFFELELLNAQADQPFEVFGIGLEAMVEGTG